MNSDVAFWAFVILVMGPFVIVLGILVVAVWWWIIRLFWELWPWRRKRYFVDFGE